MKKSRLIACLIVFAMLLSWVVVPDTHTHVHAEETPKPAVTVGSVEGKPGDTLEIPVMITENPGITYLKLLVQFDDTAAKDMIGEHYLDFSNPMAFCTFTTSEFSGTNPCVMMWDHGTQNFTAGGKLGTIKVTIKSDAKPGEYPVYIIADEFVAYNVESQAVAFDLIPGTITVLGEACTEHSFTNYVSNNDATCLTDGTETAKCDNCDVTDTRTAAGTALGHSFTNYVSNNDAACEKDGTETAKCDRCEVTDTNTVVGSALGHSFTNYVSDNNAACEEDGTKTAKCDRCDATDTTADEGSATGHSFTEYVSDGNATCAEDGTETATCDNCDATDTRTDVGSREDVDHSFPAYTSDGNATCTADGTKSRVCTVCDKKETVTDEGSALGHSFTEYVSNGDATCEEDGTKTAKCDRCDETETVADKDSALGHKFTEQTTEYPATEANCCHKATYYYSCYNPGCNAKGTETFEYGEVDKTKHVGGTEIRDAKPATEEETGYTGDTYCLGCGDKLASGEEIPKLDHTHDMAKTDAKPAACETDGNTAYWTCTKCGKLYGDAEGKQEITIEETVIPALGHSFTNYVGNGDATCEGDATETANCDRCNKADTRTVPGSAKGHSFTEYKSNGDATCVADGTETAKCDRCDETNTRTEAGSALGHSFTTYTSNGDAACVTDGTETAKCDRCDETNTRTEAGSALGHSFTTYTSNGDATCEADGTETAKCDRCDETDTRTAEGSATGHTGGEAVIENKVEATCSKNGSYDEVVYCTVCKAELSRETIVVEATGEHIYATETERVEPTCTEAGYVTKACGCGATETTVLTAAGHTAGEAVIENKVEATCATDGSYDEVVYCTVCKAELSRETIAVEATGEHIYATETERVEPTCTEAGYVTKACGCGATETTILTATGHTAGEAVIENKVEVTCTTDGKYDEVTYCTSCGEELTRNTVTVTATGHTEGEIVIENQIHATCGADGSHDEVVYCTTCGEELSRETVVDPSTGDHVYATEVERVDATCTEDGYVIKACGCGATETTILTAPGHAAGEAVIENKVEVTCTTDGKYDEVTYCTTCGEELTRNTVTVPAPGHAPGETVIENKVEVTCTTDGSYDEVVYCTTCDAELSRHTVTETALGHSYGEYVSDNNAACEEDGTETAACGRCGVTDTRTVEGSALGHDWSDWTVTTEPTCTENGVETRTCGNCGGEETQTVDALGHDWAETEVIVAPTCEEEGESVFTCSRCSVSENQITAALGHDWNETEVIVAPSCEVGGESVFTCGACAKVENQETEPLGHSYTNYVSNGDATCEADGTETAVCDVDDCGETDTRVAEGSALGHDYKSVVTEPTATEQGYTTHTCTRCGHSFVDSFVEPDPDATEPSKPGTSGGPETGDGFQTTLWTSLMVLSVLSAGVLLVNRKKWLA